ncbi:SH3 domain-containing protein [Streptomyces naphthomycinicus]|uniref:SH3 domain-containing protein n=1 Tax=Streptomyces naphthomycinicus TaxID=2872625 RepID=UPI001CED3F24|nr:SH3 domain-containing protein [Streptomyces sp. TML10]
MRLHRTLTAAVLTAGLTVAGLTATVSAAPAAQAAACGVTGSNRDTGPYGQYFLRDVNLRNGPDWACRITDTATPVNKVDYFCTTDGFTYLRTASTKYGWVYNGYLKGGGSTIPC